MDESRRKSLKVLSLSCAAALSEGVWRSGEAAQTQGGSAPQERVTGIGGFFFRAKDPKAVASWYQKNLGINLVPSSYDDRPWQQEAGYTAFAPFPENTTHFGDARYAWMLNFRVRNLDAMVAQLRAAGIEVTVDPEQYPNGRFARLRDLEGNPLDLWEPREPSRR